MHMLSACLGCRGCTPTRTSALGKKAHTVPSSPCASDRRSSLLQLWIGHPVNTLPLQYTVQSAFATISPPVRLTLPTTCPLARIFLAWRSGCWRRGRWWGWRWAARLSLSRSSWSSCPPRSAAAGRWCSRASGRLVSTVLLPHTPQACTVQTLVWYGCSRAPGRLVSALWLPVPQA